jgi:hypothetical protein
MTDHKVTNIGSRLELFVEDTLIHELKGKASLRLHQPTIQQDAFVTNMPWEGTMGGYITTFQDNDIYRMYYQAADINLEAKTGEWDCPIYIGYAESKDGINWTRPNLGLFEFNGSKENNIIWVGETETLKGVHGFVPFKDTNPDCEPDALYKAIGSVMSGTPALYAMKSADGIHWSLMQDEPILQGQAYDSQNLIFWDNLRSEYRIYLRNFTEGIFEGCRIIETAVSKDFFNWPVPKPLEYVDSPEEQLYTNQVQPYYRAPHIFIGFPSRYVEREWSPTIDALPELEHRLKRRRVAERYGMAVTDGLLMASRDGGTFKRWDEAFLRPGLRIEGSWTYGDCYQGCGLMETASAFPGAPNELSLYAVEHYWRKPSALFRRYTIRIDGFVSAHAPLGGGELITEPITFEGSSLHLNMSTSAGGGMRVEIMDVHGNPIKDFDMKDCYEIVGDTLDYTVRWKSGTDVSALAGKPIRLKFALNDADLYSYKFE